MSQPTGKLLARLLIKGSQFALFLQLSISFLSLTDFTNFSKIRNFENFLAALTSDEALFKLGWKYRG